MEINSSTILRSVKSAIDAVQIPTTETETLFKLRFFYWRLYQEQLNEKNTCLDRLSNYYMMYRFIQLILHMVAR